MRETLRCLELGVREKLRCLEIGVREKLRCLELGVREKLRCLEVGVRGKLRCLELGVRENLWASKRRHYETESLTISRRLLRRKKVRYHLQEYQILTCRECDINVCFVYSSLVTVCVRQRRIKLCQNP